jgi:hypothetical protein
MVWFNREQWQPDRNASVLERETAASDVFYDPLGAMLQDLADWVENGGNEEAAGPENRFEGAARKEKKIYR